MKEIVEDMFRQLIDRKLGVNLNLGIFGNGAWIMCPGAKSGSGR